jgi:hypothetical protein
MTGNTQTLKEFMLFNSLSCLFVDDDPHGISGEQGIFFESEGVSIYDLIDDYMEDRTWDHLVQATFNALSELVEVHPYARLTGRFFLEDNELCFEKHRQYFRD